MNQLGDKKSTGRRIALRLIGSILALAAIAIVIGAYYLLANKNKSHNVNKSSQSVAAVSAAPKDKQLAAAEAGILPWQLSSPLSRMAVYPGQNGNQLIIAGGLTASGQSASGIYTLDTTSGSLAMTGTLSSAVHDAASSTLGNSYALFGGGDTSSVNNTAVFGLSGTLNTSGSLPQPRSDATAVKVNNKVYIIGGYNGTAGDTQVLFTSDGKTFTKSASLPIPVRYAAAALSGNLIYVFGGEATTGSNAGQPIASVQIINTSNNTASVSSMKLPVPLEGASAFVINGEIFLAGGQSSVPESITPGVGTTQVPGVSVASQSDTYNTIWAIDTVSNQVLKAGTLQLPVAYAGSTVLGSRAWLIGGEYNGTVVSSVQMVTPNSAFGIAGQPGAGSPYYGAKLMIADRGNNRVVVMNPSMQITWQYPSANSNTQAAGGFYFPDDAFFANHGTAIISNQENNNTIVEIGYPSGKVLWTYGHPLQAGSASGYLNAPDDAYQLKNNIVVVADDVNCRVLFIDQATKKVVSQIGTTGVCTHNPNVSLGAVNGDTPLYDGNVLLSEIRGSWVSEYTPQGKMVWTVQLPISYPSDPQQLGAGPGLNPDKYLIADYANPGAILEFTREGKVLYRYQVTSGTGMLKYPSLVELLPSGVFMANDDHRDRMVAIDPATKALVWQYGITDQPGTTTGMIHKPDGFDILLPNGTTPTHGATQ